MTTEEFLRAELTRTQAELSRAILNRGLWDSLREDRQMLLFLERRSSAADFHGVKAELQLIADGQSKVIELSGPRRKALDCMRDWAKKLDAITQS